MRGSSVFFASIVWCSATAGCDRGDENAKSNAPPALASTASPAAPAPPTSSPSTAASAPAPTPPTLTPADTAVVTSAKSIGHTSLVLKLTFDDGHVAAFKPRSSRPLGNTRYKAEIAAYRIAQALGLRNVPVAVPRTIPMAALRSAGAVAVREAVPDRGGVAGALIPWITPLEFLALEREPLRSQWRAWLAGDPPATNEERALAEQIATMFVFDYLTANWDRFSGGNIGFDRASGTLLFLDNDGCFYEWPNPHALAAQLERIRGIRRFAPRLVEGLRALDLEAIRFATGEERPGVPLLTPRQLEGIAERRTRILPMIEATVEAGSRAAASRR